MAVSEHKERFTVVGNHSFFGKLRFIASAYDFLNLKRGRTLDFFLTSELEKRQDKRRQDMTR